MKVVFTTVCLSLLVACGSPEATTQSGTVESQNKKQNVAPPDADFGFNRIRGKVTGKAGSAISEQTTGVAPQDPASVAGSSEGEVPDATAQQQQVQSPDEKPATITLTRNLLYEVFPQFRPDYKQWRIQQANRVRVKAATAIGAVGAVGAMATGSIVAPACLGAACYLYFEMFAGLPGGPFEIDDSDY